MGCRTRPSACGCHHRRRACPLRAVASPDEEFQSRPRFSGKHTTVTSTVSASATLVLLPGLDGTDVFLRPLAAALPSTIRPLVVTYPTSGAEASDAVLEIVHRATHGLSSFYVLGLSFSGPLAVMLARQAPKGVHAGSL